MRHKILFISDDFSEHNFDTLKELIERKRDRYDDCDLEFELFLAEEFNKIPKDIKFEAVFIDYGFIDNCFDSIQFCLGVMETFCIKKIPLVWCGGLPQKYNNDAKIVFPKKRYLHNLLSCSTAHDEIFFILEELFGDKK